MKFSDSLLLLDSQHHPRTFSSKVDASVLEQWGKVTLPQNNEENPVLEEFKDLSSLSSCPSLSS